MKNGNCGDDFADICRNVFELKSSLIKMEVIIYRVSQAKCRYYQNIWPDLHTRHKRNNTNPSEKWLHCTSLWNCYIV